MQVKDLVWGSTDYADNTLYVARTDIGRFTVLDRETGYSFGSRDIETGYKDTEGKFWLVSGMFDIRDYPEMSVEEAIRTIKCCSNTCQGV